MRFQNKVVLVTGASRGLGSVLASEFAVEGAVTCLCGKNIDRLRSVQLQILSKGGRAVFEQIDIGDESQVESFASFCRRTFGRIDVFIHAPAIESTRVPFHLYPLPEWRKIIDYHCTGYLLMIKNIVPLMDRQGGTIVNLLSTSEQVMKTGSGGEGMIHGIMAHWVPLLAAELRTYDIRVNAVDIWSKKQTKNLNETHHGITEPFLHLASSESHPLTGQIIAAETFRKERSA